MFEYRTTTVRDLVGHRSVRNRNSGRERQDEDEDDERDKTRS
jgi:hypothetical protein